MGHYNGLVLVCGRMDGGSLCSIQVKEKTKGDVIKTMCGGMTHHPVDLVWQAKIRALIRKHGQDDLSNKSELSNETITQEV